MEQGDVGGHRALVAGASGLVGGHLVRRLLASPRWAAVTAVGRRALPAADAKLAQLEVDFAALPKLPAADTLFCALGTTLAKAGSRAAFRAVDRDAVVAFARAGLAAGARRLLVVSSMSADRRSPVFYSRVKGEMEELVSQLPFDAVEIARPSFLLGERAEARLGERLALFAFRALAPLLVGPLAAGRPIAADAVAAALVALAAEPPQGVRIHPSHHLRILATAAGHG